MFVHLWCQQALDWDSCDKSPPSQLWVILFSPSLSFFSLPSLLVPAFKRMRWFSNLKSNPYQEGGDLCILIADSCCTAQTNTIIYNNNCKAIILQIKINLKKVIQPHCKAFRRIKEKMTSKSTIRNYGVDVYLVEYLLIHMHTFLTVIVF